MARFTGKQLLRDKYGRVQLCIRCPRCNKVRLGYVYLHAVKLEQLNLPVPRAVLTCAACDHAAVAAWNAKVSSTSKGVVDYHERNDSRRVQGDG